MKHIYLYIVCLFALLVQTGCKDEEALSTQEGKRTVTVNLGIAMSRVALKGDPETTYGPADDMKVWIFDEEGNPLAYAEKEKPPFSIEDVEGNLVESVTMDFEITGAKTLYLRVLLNTDNVMLNNLALDKDTKMSDIDEATFTFKTDVALGDNKVPMYGKESIPIDDKKNYDIDVEVTRAVGKLELFFTKESETSTLTINSIELDNVPDKGYLNGEYTSTDIAYTEHIDNLINKTLIATVSDAELGNFSQDESNFTKLDLTQDYLLENPNGGIWSEVDGNTDYVYPEESEIEDKDSRYKMTVNYTLGSNSAVDQVVYLPKIVRNEWNKIFVRVKDNGKVEIQYRAMPWEEEESQIGWNPEIDNGGNAPMAAWRLYRVDGVSDADYENHVKGSMEINPDHEDATNGDEEATFCYVLYPRYDNKKDAEGHALHEGFEDKPSYAGFYFCLKEPEGAIWEAYLTNTDDFRFGTGKYDIDGDQIADRFCVTRGRARDEAYQIQVTARNKWTEPKFEKDSEDNYVTINTVWGNKIEADESYKDIHTDLYIRISLDGGNTWNYLDINKRDTAKDPKNKNAPYLTHTNWGWEVQKGETHYRRFAGGDKYIRIWQLKATYGAGFDELIENLDNTWAIKQYWKPIDYNESK